MSKFTAEYSRLYQAEQDCQCDNDHDRCYLNSLLVNEFAIESIVYSTLLLSFEVFCSNEWCNKRCFKACTTSSTSMLRCCKHIVKNISFFSFLSRRQMAKRKLTMQPNLNQIFIHLIEDHHYDSMSPKNPRLAQSIKL